MNLAARLGLLGFAAVLGAAAWIAVRRGKINVAGMPVTPRDGPIFWIQISVAYALAAVMALGALLS